MTIITQSPTKICTGCHKTYPATLEFFFKQVKRNGKTYLRPRCKTCCVKSHKAWQQRQSEEFHVSQRERQRKWTQTPKGAYKSLRNGGHGHPILISQMDFVDWYKSQPRRCCYCGLEESQLQLVADAYNNKVFRLTVDRIDSTKTYERGNLVLCCLRCNHIKGDFFTRSEMEEIGKKYIAPKWR